jgi:hypothetical protein
MIFQFQSDQFFSNYHLSNDVLQPKSVIANPVITESNKEKDVTKVQRNDPFRNENDENER